MNDIKSLCEKLDYQFQDEKLLMLALCHRSHGRANNERLEFLGDAAVNFIIGKVLFHKFSKAKEGDLSRLRANLVKGETLAELAKELDVHDFIRLGHGERLSGGSKRKSILADAMEAIIGAMYLDSDFETCQKKVLKWYESRLANIKSADELKDPKTKLQEFLQAQKYPLPNYEIINTKGEAHKQIFHIECTVTGLSQKAVGSGSSRRKAEQQAAQKFLEIITHA